MSRAYSWDADVIQTLHGLGRCVASMSDEMSTTHVVA